MVSPLEIAIKKMLEVGFFDILTFILFLGVFYAIIKKSRVLGDSVFLNGIAALAISFFIFLYPFLTGFSLIQNLARFFLPVSLVALLFLVALLLAAFFYPNLPQVLAATFTRRTTLWVMIGISLFLLIISGLLQPVVEMVIGKPAEPLGDVRILVAGIIIFVVLILVAAAVGRG